MLWICSFTEDLKTTLNIFMKQLIISYHLQVYDGVDSKLMIARQSETFSSGRSKGNIWSEYSPQLNYKASKVKKHQLLNTL